MPTLHREANWKLTIYKDHNPPHFHVIVSDGSEALIAISDLRLLDGAVPAKVLKAARAWAAAHKQELHSVWERCNP